MRRRKLSKNKVCHCSGERVERLENKQSNNSRTQQILAELGIDSKEWQLESKLILLNRMAKIGLI